MKVNLQRDWFAPNGMFFKRSHNPNNVPDDLKSALPKDAKIVEKYVAPQKETATSSLRDFDEVRAADKAVKARIDAATEKK